MTILYTMTPKNAKVRASSTRNTVTHSDSTQTRRIGNSKNCDADRYYREIARFQRVVRDTMSHIHRTKSLDIINGSDFNSCVTSLEGISEKLRVLHTLLDTAVKTSAVFMTPVYQIVTYPARHSRLCLKSTMNCLCYSGRMELQI